MSNTYYSSDSHFFHKRIKEFCPETRLGDSVEEMNELLIEAWNDRVRPADTIYHLGDFSFGNVEQNKSIVNRLNGKIHLIKGNHDKKQMMHPDVVRRFSSVQDYLVTKEAGHKIIMMHFPIESWDSSGYGSIHLHGHTHMQWNAEQHPSHYIRRMKNRMDVGVDAREEKDMAPFSLEEILETIKRRNELIDVSEFR